MKHKEPPVEPRLLTVRQAAAYIGQTASAFRTMIRRGQIPDTCVYRLPGRTGTNARTGKPHKGRKLLIEKAALDQFLDTLRKTA
jgi:hypothetical protein